jgi:hypothetical protein
VLAHAVSPPYGGSSTVRSRVRSGGRSVSVASVEAVHELALRSFGDRLAAVWLQLAEQLGEPSHAYVVQTILAPEKDNLVFKQGLADLPHDRFGQIRAYLDTGDFGADVSGDAADGDLVDCYGHEGSS